MRTGGTAVAIRRLSIAIGIISVLVIYLVKKTNYTFLHNQSNNNVLRIETLEKFHREDKK